VPQLRGSEQPTELAIPPLGGHRQRGGKAGGASPGKRGLRAGAAAVLGWGGNCMLQSTFSPRSCSLLPGVSG